MTVYHHELDLLMPGVPVVRQGREQCCIAAGEHGQLMVHRRRAVPTDTFVPNLYQLWYDMRRFSPGATDYNTGGTLENMARALAVYGYTDSDWRPPGAGEDTPWTTPWVEPPLPAVSADAATRKGVVLERMPFIKSGPDKDSAVESIRMHLAMGYAVLAAGYVSADFFQQNARPSRDWRDWTWTHNVNDLAQEHAVLIVGDSCDRKVLKYLNSHGLSFGVDGCAGMPHDKVQAGPQKCFYNFYILKDLQGFPAMPVPTTPTYPTALDPAQMTAYETEVRAKLQTAFNINGWPGALGTAVLMGLSDKQFEMYAPGPNNTPTPLPRFTVRKQVNEGLLAWPTGMREEQGE